MRNTVFFTIADTATYMERNTVLNTGADTATYMERNTVLNTGAGSVTIGNPVLFIYSGLIVKRG
jgi:hypothetical protein